MTLLEQYMADYQRVCAEKVELQEQLQSLQVALSFYAEKGGDGGAVARSVLKNERPPEHVFRFFADLHGVPYPASEPVIERKAREQRESPRGAPPSVLPDAPDPAKEPDA